MLTKAPVALANLNLVLLRRQNQVILPESLTGRDSTPEKNQVFLASLLKNLESYGFCLDRELLDRASQMSLEQLTELNKLFLDVLPKVTGAHQSFQPMYPNFPMDVMKKSNVELYINAMLHYLTSGKFMPLDRKKDRESLIEHPSLRTVRMGGVDDAEKLLRALMNSPVSFSQQDSEDLRVLVEAFGSDTLTMIPDSVTNRENKARILAALRSRDLLSEEVLSQHINTVTDVLRLAAAMSGGDASLAEPVKFQAIRRPERRMLLSAMEAQATLAEDMIRHKERYKRLGEKLHPGEYRKRYPRVYEAFEALRKDRVVETFDRKLEMLLLAGDIDSLVKLLKGRPGVFARRLDQLLRLAGDGADRVGFAFKDVIDRVPTPLLIQIGHHFAHRREHRPFRVFLPKGNMTRAQVAENKLPELSETACLLIEGVCREALLKRFAELPPLGACFVDEGLRDFTVPFALRSASKALRTVARGSRLTLPESDTLRFFLWWKNGRQRTDLDLSAAMFDEDFRYIDVLSYYNLKNFGGHHSGDIVDAPNGASEFIDVSIARLRERNVRFIVMTVHSFTRQPMKDLPECFAGWMARSKPNSGEVFEARTVVDRFDLSGDTRIALPVIFDIERRQAVWTDLALKGNPRWVNNVDGSLGGINYALAAMVELSRPNLYDLFALHAEARGRLVRNPEEADVEFTVEKTPFELESITSQYMT
ncbi:MAG: TerD family protein [Cyanobacteria bacterium HKST-UBA02]|nr:TerD family protein [Cyanobacteria bacterium HKST-UBA02]